MCRWLAIRPFFARHIKEKKVNTLTYFFSPPLTRTPFLNWRFLTFHASAHILAPSKGQTLETERKKSHCVLAHMIRFFQSKTKHRNFRHTLGPCLFSPPVNIASIFCALQNHFLPSVSPFSQDDTGIDRQTDNMSMRVLHHL